MASWIATFRKSRTVDRENDKMSDNLLICNLIMIAIMILSIVVASGVHLKSSEQRDFLCNKIYKTDLKSDSEIKQIYDDVEVRLSELFPAN